MFRLTLPARRWSAAGVVAAIIGAAVVAPDGLGATGPTANTRITRASAARRGRPRKFNKPTRAVTLTLPEDTIAALRNLDRDLSRAVVRVAAPHIDAGPRKPAELSTFGRRSVIVVTPSRALTERTGAELVPIPDGRALIALNDDLSPANFELRLIDALADPALAREDRETFESIAAILRTTRSDGGTRLAERQIMVLHRV